MSNKWLITGAAGFIGSNFLHYIVDNKRLDFDNGDSVLVIDKLSYASNKKNLSRFESEPNYKFLQLDLSNSEKVSDAIKNFQPDFIIHFAAESHVDRSLEDPRPFITSNIIGTFNLLEAVRKYSLSSRFHHISTDEVHGTLDADKDNKFDENSNYDPRNPYSATKAAADHLVNAYHHSYGLKTTISSCTNNYGPRCFPEKLIPLVITRAIRDLPIPVYADGLQIRDWIHTNDHAFGVDLILQKAELGSIYKLGGDGEHTNLSIVKKILKYLDKQQDLIVHVGDRLGHDKRYAIDYSKAKTDLGFSPQENFETRLHTTIDWYKENTDWWMPIIDRADEIAEKYLSLT